MDTKKTRKKQYKTNKQSGKRPKSWYLSEIKSQPTEPTEAIGVKVAGRDARKDPNKLLEFRTTRRQERKMTLKSNSVKVELEKENIVFEKG